MKTDFYQIAISEPHSQCPDFLAALANDEQLRAVQQQQIAEEDAMLALFSSTPAPSQTHLDAIAAISSVPDKKSWSINNYMAIAASVLVGILSLNFIDFNHEQHNQHLANHTLNHTSHGHSYAGVTNTHPSLSRVNLQLASYGARIDDVDDLLWNKDCDYEGITSAHLVYQDQSAKINVYVVPDSYQFSEVEKVFSDERYQGTIKKVNSNYLVIVGPKGHDLAPISERIDNELHWNI